MTATGKTVEPVHRTACIFPAMSSIGERVKQRRAELGLSQTEVGSRAGGLKYQTIQDLENGTSKSSRYLVEIAAALKVNPQWLKTGEGNMDPLFEGKPPGMLDNPRPEPQLPRTDLMPRNLPVFGSASCGDDGEFEFNTGDVIDYVKRPARLEGIKDAYALYLTGSSMVPWRKKGQLVYVHPGQPPQIEDHVVVQLKPPRDGEAPHAMVKQLVKMTGRDIVLRQYNPPRDMPFPRSRIVTIHRVVEWDELLGI